MKSIDRAGACSSVTARLVRSAPLLVPLAALSACGSGLYSQAPVTEPASSSNPTVVSASQLASLSPVQIVRTTVGLTDVPFIRYDISPSMSYSYGFSVADYDGTGLPAIAYFDSYVSGHDRLRTQTGAIGHVMYNSGENDVIYPQELFPGLSTTNPDEFLLERNVAIDVNGDGKLDIAGVSNSHSAVVSYINPGTHNTPWARRVLSSLTPGPVNLAAGDINGDGLPDIVVAMRYQPDSNPAGATIGIAWLENTGQPTGEWIYHPIDTTAANWGDPRTVQIADINGDGKMDVVTSDAVTGTVAWYEQVTPTNWIRHVIPGVNTQNAHFGIVMDVDGDGHPDILLPVTAGVSWLRNNGNGSSWQVYPIVQFTDSNWVNLVTEVAAGDVHHDGTLDVVLAVGQLTGGYSTVRSGGVYIAHPTSSGWTLGRVYQTENDVCAVRLANFDSTGVPSIVSNAEYQQNSITLWQNQIGAP